MRHNLIDTLKVELELDLVEIEAYRELDGQIFTFGGYEMRNDGEFNLGSEDVYYKMDAQGLKDAILDLEYEKKIIFYNRQDKTKQIKINKHQLKNKHKNKLKNLNKYTWWTTYYHEDLDYYERFYLSGRKGFAKLISKRIVRHRYDFALKGNGYRRCFDYWYCIF